MDDLPETLKGKAGKPKIEVAGKRATDLHETSMPLTAVKKRQNEQWESWSRIQIISENNIVLKDLHMVIFLNIPPYSKLSWNISHISPWEARRKEEEEKSYLVSRRKSSMDRWDRSCLASIAIMGQIIWETRWENRKQNKKWERGWEDLGQIQRWHRKILVLKNHLDASSNSCK